MTQKADWQERVGDSWAREWRRTDRSFAPLTKILVASILGRGAAHSILDIGCGAGDLALRLSEAKPGSRVLGIDISAALIEAARSRLPKAARCEFAVADAATWHEDWFYPDLLVSRHGVMFFDDPVGAFAHLAENAADGARLVFSCFRDRTLNPWANEVARLLPSTPAADPHAPGPFAFADADRVESVLAAAGWTQVKAEPVDFQFVTGEGDDPVGDALGYFAAIGPAAPAISALEGVARADLMARLRALCDANLKGGAVAFGAAAWIMSAVKAG